MYVPLAPIEEEGIGTEECGSWGCESLAGASFFDQGTPGRSDEMGAPSNDLECVVRMAAPQWVLRWTPRQVHIGSVTSS